MSELRIQRLVVSSERRFLLRLDEATASLQQALPRGARNWGTARKAINIFLRDVLYSSYLSPEYSMHEIREWMELPLDSYTATALREARKELPRWVGVKHLTPDFSALLQAAALEIAGQERIARVDLDVLYWRADTLGVDD